MVTEYLTAKEVSERLKVSAQTLANWRTARRGPPWTKCEAAVRYPEDGLRHWLDARTEMTREKGAA